MGEVWRARDTKLSRDVAIKVLPEAVASDPKALSRFEHEAKAVAALSHPNILAIFDFGNQDGIAYAVTELLEGETVRALLAKGPLSPRRAVEISVQVAHGLAAAHGKGVVHRDLKPENLFATKDGHVKILDFGLARWAGPAAQGDETSAPTAEKKTDPGVVMGTVGYMSPEQVRGEVVDHRSDIFSFGAVLYELLSGRQAFRRPSSVETMAAILKEDPPEIEESGRSIPMGLRRIVDHCLEKSPARRFRDALDLAFALGNLSSGQDRADSPLGPRGRTVAPKRAALAALLVSIAGVAGWLLKQGPSPLPSFRKLTFGRGAIDGARFVPGSRDVVYSARWQGNPSAVFLLREGSPEPRALEVPAAVLLGASSQGTVAVQTRGTLHNGLFEGTVSVVPLAGGGAREVSRNATAADFSPEGSSLCLVSSMNAFSYQLEWPQGEVLLKGSTVLASPRVRGDLVAFFRSKYEGGAEGEILVMGKGGTPRPLAASKGFVSLAWGPDGNEIWFSAYDGSESLIEAISLKGRRRILARHPGRLELVDVDPGGRCLAIASSHLRQAFGRAPGAAHDLDITWLEAQTPSGLSLDGKLVLLTRFGDWEMLDRVSLYLRPMDGGAAVKVGTGSGGAHLSPDGRRVITWEADVGGRNGVRLIPAAVGASRWYSLKGVARGVDGLWFHPSGSQVYFDDEGKQSIARLDLESGTVTPDVVPPSVTYFLGQNPFSPDGRRMLLMDAAVAVPEGDAFLMSLLLFEGERSKPVPVKGNRQTEAVAGWDDASLEVYLYDRNAIPAEVVRWNPVTGTRIPFLQIAPPDPTGVWGIQALHVTPSGRAYAYGVVRKLSDLYLIEGLR